MCTHIASGTEMLLFTHS